MHSTTAAATTSLAALLTLVSTASAAVHDVKVGDSGLIYEPSSINAAKGDTVVFHFYPGDHNVVQGQFNTPCGTSGGFYSGFINPDSGASNETFTITVADTNPIWIYCSQEDHCQLGMAMAINAPTTGNTLGAYLAAAAKTSISTTPAHVGGGVLGSGSGSGSSSSSSPGPSSSTVPKSSSSSSPPPSSTAAGSSGSSSAAGSSTAAAGTSAGSTPPSQTSVGGATGTSATGSPSMTKSAAAGGFAGEKSVMGVLAILALWVGIL